MNVSYKGHLIHAAARHHVVRNEWIPTLVVVWGKPWTFQEIVFADTFLFELAAQAYARYYGKRWIDAGKPLTEEISGPVSFVPNSTTVTALAQQSIKPNNADFISVGPSQEARV